MSEQGLSPGRSGNLSCRLGAGMLITPSAMVYAEMTEGDLVVVDEDGRATGGNPSSEWRFHLAVYRTRDDVHALVHTHSRFATTLACAHRAIPAFHYMVAMAGGSDIPVVPYALFGTQELADQVAAALAGRDACLMANHGLCAVGDSPAAALELAVQVEALAGQYLHLLQLGEVHLLSDAQMNQVRARFGAYRAGSL